MNVGDVYAGPRRGRLYKIVEIGPEPGKVHILALWYENAKPQSATAALMTPGNGWHRVQEKSVTNGDQDAESQ